MLQHASRREPAQFGGGFLSASALVTRALLPVSFFLHSQEWLFHIIERKYRA
jgi:hypothetical protein